MDKVHVIKSILGAVDKVGCREIRSKDKKNRTVQTKSKYIWLKNPEDLTENQKTRLKALKGLEYFDIVTAYDFRLRMLN